MYYLQEIDVSRVSIKHPKRYDTYMAGKVVLDEDEKLVIDMMGVRVVSIKSANDNVYMKLKLPKDMEYALLGLEERLVDVVAVNVDDWFKNKMNKRTVDEYFQSALVFHPKMRCLMKIKVEKPIALNFDLDGIEKLVGKRVDLKLRFHSVKFTKAAFWMCYQLADIVECDERLGFVRDDDDVETGSVVAFEDLGDAGPDPETREELRCHYIKKLKEAIKEGEGRIEAMARLMEELERNNNFSVAVFDAAENILS